MGNELTSYTVLNFKRDFILGDTGEDVGSLHNIMGFLGYGPSEEEIKEKRFGKSTLAQAEKLREAISNNPLLAFASFILQFIFGSDIEEATPELRRGNSKPIREYRASTDPELQSLEAVSTSKKGAAGAAELAGRYIGQRETGDNKGAVVKYFNGAEGEPWCGGFVHKIMAKAISPALYSQGDFLRARSFGDEAAKHGAFRKPSQGYAPAVGDVVVFTRGGEKGHVGIVSDVAENGTVTYISGNDANAVRARTFDRKNPPQSLLGYGDTHALAKAKGITLDVPSIAMTNTKVTMGATRHSDTAIRGG